MQLDEQLKEAIADENAGEMRQVLYAPIEWVDVIPRRDMGRFVLRVHGRLDDLLRLSGHGQVPDSKKPQSGLWGF